MVTHLRVLHVFSNFDKNLKMVDTPKGTTGLLSQKISKTENGWHPNILSAFSNFIQNKKWLAHPKTLPKIFLAYYWRNCYNVRMFILSSSANLYFWWQYKNWYVKDVMFRKLFSHKSLKYLMSNCKGMFIRWFFVTFAFLFQLLNEVDNHNQT